MGNDELTSLKAVRKAKKKEIQAWITAFEEREGRPPEATDKEAIRPMYREFRELEAKIKSVMEGSGGSVDGAAEVVSKAKTSGGESPGGSLTGTGTADTAVGLGGGVDVDDMDLSAIKKERDAKKRDIKQWIQEFEEREGHPPTTKEKAPIRELYLQFKDLERRLADSSKGERGDDVAISSEIESIKAEKKTVKRGIQAWVEAFEAREGRAPLQEDKSEIRPLYKRHKDLERELTHLRTMLSTSADVPSVSTPPSPSVPREDATIKDIDPTSTILSPSSSMGEIAVMASLEDGEVKVGDTSQEQDTSQESKGKGNAMKSSNDGDNATPELPLSLPSSAPDGPTAREGRAGETVTENDYPSIGVAPSGIDDDGAAGAKMGEGKGSPQVASILAEPDDAHQDQTKFNDADNHGGDGDERTRTKEGLGGISEDFGAASPSDDLERPVPSRSSSTPPSGHEAEDQAGTEEKKVSWQGTAVAEKEEAAMSGQREATDVDIAGGDRSEGIQKGEDVNKLPEEKGLLGDLERTAFTQIDGKPPFSGGRSFVAGVNDIVDAQLMLGDSKEATRELGDFDDKPVTAQEERVRRMRARFLHMKSLIDNDPAIPSSPTSAAGRSPHSDLGDGPLGVKIDEFVSPSVVSVIGAKDRWTLLGDAIAPNRLSRSPCYSPRRALDDEPSQERTSGTTKALQPPSIADGRIATEDGHEEAPADSVLAPLADDGVSREWISGQMSNLLLSDAPPPPPPAPSGLVDLEAKALRLSTAVDPPTPGYVANYQTGVRGAEIVVTSVGVEEVRARERALELERLANAREETNVYRAREANLLSREDRARRRVLAYKHEIERKVAAEKKAIIEISIAGERALAPAFARARRGLERAIQAQAGRVREVFGELRPGETPAGRRFRVDWKGVPQPVEIRLHCIRAVRDRLPRGSYVMLSSMAERLGGRVMRWRKGTDFDDFDDEDSIDTDGGDTRPAATLPVKHGGRYFDRELRLDQNVYQLCPSKSNVRPGNILVFELFRLAGSGGDDKGGGGIRCGSSRHKGGEIDEDTAVGWCVLPLADSRLRVVRGSFRIPLLRGEPNPNIDLHEGLEKLIAADLEAWLGNLYLDIRHLPREARLEDAGPEGGSAIGGEGFDIEYDHIRKSTRLGKGLMGKLAKTAGRWQRWKARRKDVAGNNGDSDGDSDGESDDEDDDDNGDKSELGDETSQKEDRDIESGEGGNLETNAATPVKEVQSLSPLVEGSNEITKKEVADQEKRDDSISRPSGDEEEGLSTPSRQQEEEAGDQQETQSLESSKKQPKAAWFGTRKKKTKRIDTAMPPKGSSRAKAKPKKKQRKGNGGIDAPPPQGAWASHVDGEEDDDTGDNNEDHVKVEETIDEECLSDDDMPRGKTFRFTPAGEAALAVDTASGASAHTGGNAKTVGLRRRGEGARWDSAALGLGHRGLPKRYSRATTGAKDSYIWTPLTNPAEMEFYRFAVASDPGTDAPPTPAHVIAHKLRYIQQEVLLDLHPRGWRVVEYWLAVMIFIGALWLRVYMHALGQWFLLYSLGVPVFSFSPRLWELAIKYMDRSSSLGVEIAFVWWGPTFVMLCFAAIAALTRLWGVAACGGKGGGGGEGVPEAFSRFVAAFGVAAGLDPYLLLVVDFMAGNHNCESKCPDYTSPSCRCHEGDAWKLYVRLNAEEGAGVTGALLTVLIYAMVSVATALILHEYLLHAHMNGRMLDIWRRLNADEDNFFVPHDLELSAAELQHACARARRWRGANGGRREVIFYDFQPNPDDHEQSANASHRSQSGGGGGGGGSGGRKRARGAQISHTVIYDVSADGKKSLHRQFLRTSDGTILEVFGEDGRGVGWQLTSSLNALIKEEIGDGGRADEAQKDQGIFAGMLPMEAPTPETSAAAREGGEKSTVDS